MKIKELTNAPQWLIDAMSTLFMRIEERHGAKVASEYPEVVRGRAAIARATGGKT